MRRPFRDWRIWTGLSALCLVIFLMAPKPAVARVFNSLAQIVFGQSGGWTVETDTPQPTLVAVGGPGSAGGLQLADMTGQYEKVDLVVQNSTGPFVFKRTFRSSLGYWKQVGNGPSAFHTRPQWFTNLNSTAQWTQATMGGFDYVVTDPESGSFLYYYSNQPLNSGTHTPHTGFQIPGDAANDKKLYLDAAQSDGGITGYVLFTSSRHYYYFNGDGAHTYYLTRVEDTRYADAGSVTLANISTSGMTVANIGYSDAGSITTVTTGDGVVVIFNYSGSLLQSLSIDGGTVVSYAYNAGGLITQATYDDGTGEQYGYGTNSNGFSATTLTGKPIVSYVIDAGPGAGRVPFL